MDDRESFEIRTMRNMAWERAKGELRSMLQTYWDNGQSYKAFKDEMDSFIAAIEDEGLQE